MKDYLSFKTRWWYTWDSYLIIGKVLLSLLSWSNCKNLPWRSQSPIILQKDEHSHSCQKWNGKTLILSLWHTRLDWIWIYASWRLLCYWIAKQRSVPLKRMEFRIWNVKNPSSKWCILTCEIRSVVHPWRWISLQS